MRHCHLRLLGLVPPPLVLLFRVLGGVVFAHYHPKDCWLHIIHNSIAIMIVIIIIKVNTYGTN